MGLNALGLTQGLYRGVDLSNEMTRQDLEERRLKVAEQEARDAAALRALQRQRLQQEQADEAFLPGDITAIMGAARGGILPTVGGTTPAAPEDLSDLAGQNLLTLKEVKRAQTLPELAAQVPAASFYRVLRKQPGVIDKLGLKTPEQVEQQTVAGKALSVFNVPAPQDTAGRLSKLYEMTIPLVQAGHPLGTSMANLLISEWSKDPEVPAAFVGSLFSEFNAGVKAGLSRENAIGQAVARSIENHPGAFRSDNGRKFIETFKGLYKPEELKGFGPGTAIYRGTEPVGTVPPSPPPVPKTFQERATAITTKPEAQRTPDERQFLADYQAGKYRVPPDEGIVADRAARREEAGFNRRQQLQGQWHDRYLREAQSLYGEKAPEDFSGASAIPQEWYDAAKMPADVYEHKYGEPKPDLTAIAAQRARDLLLQLYPPETTKGWSQEKLRAAVERVNRILQREGLKSTRGRPGARR